MTDVPDGWRLWPNGQPYPEGVELDSYGEPYEAAGFYALRQALAAGGCADPHVDAWNGLAQLRGLGFDIVWERRSPMWREIERLTAENEVLRQRAAELLPHARRRAVFLAAQLNAQMAAEGRALLAHLDAGEFDV